MSNYITLIISWAVYLALHSVLATTASKQAFGLNKRVYRAMYSFLSTLGLLWIVYLMATTRAEYFFSQTFVIKYVGMGLGVWGVLLMVAAFREISLKAFVGLKPEQEAKLITTGIHAQVRHPIYSGGLVMLLGMFISVPSSTVLISMVCIVIYLPVGIYLEEKKLIKEFGEEYTRYKEQVKAIIPGVL